MSDGIVTNFWAKPIPDRRFDWSATYDDYDGGGPIGHGRTEGQAILDLTTNYPRDEPVVPYRTEFRGRRDASSILSAIAMVAFLGALLLLLP